MRILVGLVLDLAVVVLQQQAVGVRQDEAAPAVVVVKALLHAPDAPLPLPGGLGEGEGVALRIVCGAAVHIVVTLAVPGKVPAEKGVSVKGLQAVAGEEIGAELAGECRLESFPVFQLGLGAAVGPVEAHVGGGHPGVVPIRIPGKVGHPAAAPVGAQVLLLVLQLAEPGDGAEPAHIHRRPALLVAGLLIDCHRVLVGEHQQLAGQLGGDGHPPRPQGVQVVPVRPLRCGGGGRGGLDGGVRLPRGLPRGLGGGGGGLGLGGLGAVDQGAGPQGRRQQGGQRQGRRSSFPMVHNGHQPFFQTSLFLTQRGHQQTRPPGGRGADRASRVSP